MPTPMPVGGNRDVLQALSDSRKPGATQAAQEEKPKRRSRSSAKTTEEKDS